MINLSIEDSLSELKQINIEIDKLNTEINAKGLDSPEQKVNAKHDILRLGSLLKDKEFLNYCLTYLLTNNG